MNNYYMPGTVLGSINTVRNKTGDRASAVMEFTFWRDR